MKRVLKVTWPVPLALLGVVVLAYGIVIPWLGLYGDDWPYLWVRHTVGTQGYIDFVAWDRPFSAWIYLLTTPILGENLPAYHIFLALMRWVNALLIWWVMRLVWPERRALAAWTALLFVVYPGFRQQPIPLEFMLHFSTLALFLLSFAAMLLAARNPRRFWLYTALNMVCALSIFGLEYYAGLELLRPLFLWLVLGQAVPAVRPRLKRVLLLWLPNLLVLAAFAVWRVFIFEFPTYQPEFITALSSNPLQAVYLLGLRILTDLRAVTFGAWRQVFAFPHEPRLLAIYVLVFAASAALSAAALISLRRREPPASATVKETWLPVPLLLGLFALILAGVPFWFTGLPVNLNFPWDRSTLAFMLGASWLVAGVVEMFQPRFRVLILAVLVGLAAGSQVQTADNYRFENSKLRDFYWQLAWRAPGLQPGTILVSEQIPLNYYGDNGLTPPLNWTYAPEQKTTQQVYNFFDLGERLETTLPALEEGLDIQRVYRSFSFAGSSSDILAVFYQEGRCLQVLGPEDALLPELPAKLSEALAISHLDQIVTDANPPAQPPAHLLGAEPARGWCYYYQKAGLALQKGDAQTVAALGEEAQAQGFSPYHRAEWLPFLTGYIRVGNWERVAEINTSLRENTDLIPALCGAWMRGLDGLTLNAAGDQIVQEQMRGLKCK